MAQVNLWENQIYYGDCLLIVKNLPTNSIDLIITSPPYGDQRKNIYGGVHPNKYLDWFLPRSEQFLRVLKPNGTFILNIKEKVVKKERHTYVLELILAMREQGWKWTEEWIWHKKTSMPGKWPNRFRDAWERCLQFNKTYDFNMYQDEVMVPAGEWTKDRMQRLNKNDLSRAESSTKSGFSRRVANWKNRDLVYPTNVIHLSPETSNKKHSAVFPKELPRFFIKLFSKENDVIMDPFVGSGTAVVEAKKLNRRYIGIDIHKEYVDLTSNNLNRD